MQFWGKKFKNCPQLKYWQIQTYDVLVWLAKWREVLLLEELVFALVRVCKVLSSGFQEKQKLDTLLKKTHKRNSLAGGVNNTYFSKCNNIVTVWWWYFWNIFKGLLFFINVEYFQYQQSLDKHWGFPVKSKHWFFRSKRCHEFVQYYQLMHVFSTF